LLKNPDLLQTHTFDAFTGLRRLAAKSCSENQNNHLFCATVKPVVIKQSTGFREKIRPPKLKTEWILLYLEVVSAFCASDALLPSSFGIYQKITARRALD